MPSAQSSTDTVFTTIEQAIEELRQGRMLIVVDDENRENEGDFLMAADKVTPEAVNFMVTHGRGLVCVPITAEKAHGLNLDHMVLQGADPEEAAFTISIDHKARTSTGISAPDRAATIQEMLSPETKAEDFRRPGHVFPLIGVEGGVLRRPGHTEASIDLARLAGLQPAGVICEIMSDDGEMARVPELMEMAQRFNLSMITIEDLVRYRLENESLIQVLAQQPFTSEIGDFTLTTVEEVTTGDRHYALTKGEWTQDDAVLVRAHSSDILADTFRSTDSTQSGVLEKAMKMIQKEGQGVVLYMNHHMKALSHNDSEGRKRDEKDYGVGAQILYELGIRKLRLLTNHPTTRVGLESFGLRMVETVPLD